MARRNTSYDKSYVGSSFSELKSENLRKRVSDGQRAANLVKDLRAPVVPLAVARSEAKRIKELGRALAAGRISIEDVRAQLRGAA